MLCAALLAAVLPLRAQLAPSARQVDADTVAGIVYYTRWPAADAGARSAVRHCVAAAAAGPAALASSPPPAPTLAQALAQALAQSAGLAGGGVALRTSSTLAPAALRDCDVVVIDGEWGDDAVRGVLRAFAEQPVLMVGFGAGFCSIGGSVCLQPGAQGTRFSINADALARSGLDIDPRALLLGRGKRRDAAGATEGAR